MDWDTEQRKFIRHAKTCHNEDVGEQMLVLIFRGWGGETALHKGPAWGFAMHATFEVELSLATCPAKADRVNVH